MPKNTEESIHIIRIDLIFQKISAMRKGNPVCPEKNKSLLAENRAIIFVLPIMAWVGKGPICVRLTKIARIKVKRPIE